MLVDYVSLHNYTSFSLMRGLSRPIDLFEEAKELGQKAIAITDYGSMAGIWDCYKASQKTGVKLIVGCEFNFVPDVSKSDAPLHNIILLAKNAEGYKNLLILSKLGYDNFIVTFKKAVPRIDWSLLEKYSKGLICLSGGGNGVIPQVLMAKNFDSAKLITKRFIDIFDNNFALEFQPHFLRHRETAYNGSIDQNFINRQLKKLVDEFNCNGVITTNSLYVKKEHHRSHDVLLAIGSGQPITSQNRLVFGVNDFYLKHGFEVAQDAMRHFSDGEFVKKLIDNTIYYADQCENPDWIDLKYSNPSGKELPEFPVKHQNDYEVFLKWKKSAPNLDEDKLYLRYRCELGFARKTPKGLEKEYRERLNEELDVIETLGFSSYMLIVADFIEFARNNGVRVGPGRGSVAGCCVAYFLDIHVVDPIKYKLIFARFLNKEKKAYPDIDVDFSSSGRALVQDYIRRKYGDDYVAHVSNVNTITPKVYARDIARTFEFTDGKMGAVEIGNNIADSIPKEYTKVTSALEGAPLFAEYAKQYTVLAEFADTVGNKARAWSTHAGGLVIGGRPLVGLVPLRRDTEGNLVLEYDKDRAEEVGLVKMDTLGVSTLDKIDETYKIITENNKELPPDPPDLNDKVTYDLISSGNTFCIFQLGGTAESLCRAIKPKNIIDISHINSLVRPAAKTIRDDFIKTRDGVKEIELLHPLLQRAFGDTYGFGLFEEALLYLAQDIAGWDLHYADRLRKLTKEKGKNPEKVKAWRKEFIDDAVKNKQVPKDIATKIWDDVVAEFGGYGFNSAHSLSYSILSYYTAYLKTHYPLEFLIAELRAEVKSNTPVAKDNIIRIKKEIKSLGVKIVPPDINTSDVTYKIIDDKTVMTGLNSLKYIGKDSIPEILVKRPFKTFEEFLSKVDGKKVRAPAIQALAASGCLDSFGIDRKIMFFYAGDYKKKLTIHLKKALSKRGLFNYPWPQNEIQWNSREKYALEKKYLGEGLSGTIYERYDKFFNGKELSFTQLSETFKYKFYSDDEKENRKKNTFYCTYGQKINGLKGIVTNIFAFKVKKEDSKIRGEIMARITIQDTYGNNLLLLAFPDAWKRAQERIFTELSGGKHKFEEGIAIFFDGAFQYEDEFTTSFILDSIIAYKEEPELPSDLEARKVKMPRTSKKDIESIEDLNKEQLAEKLEDELVEDGIYSVDEDDEFDPFI